MDGASGSINGVAHEDILAFVGHGLLHSHRGRSVIVTGSIDVALFAKCQR